MIGALTGRCWPFGAADHQHVESLAGEAWQGRCVQLATPLVRRDPSSVLLSVALIDGRLIARLATDKPASDYRDWLSFVGTAGTVSPAGGGSTSYDGAMWLHSLAFGGEADDPIESLRGLQAVVDGRTHSLTPVAPAVLRSATTEPAGLVAREGTCMGCETPTTSAATFCDTCMAAIRSASEAGQMVNAAPDGIVPLGTPVGKVGDGEVTLIDIEVYAGMSLLRTWWAVSADENEPLSALRSPFDRRMELHADTGEHYVVAPGGAWATDGNGVETCHRIIGAIRPETRSLRIVLPGRNADHMTIDLP